MTNTFQPDDIVFSFEHLGKTYQIVRMAGFPWRKVFGFKPKDWPYVLVSASGYAMNGVSESDLDWYRRNRYTEATMNRKAHYDSDGATFSADAYTVRGWGKGIAFYVLGWETEPDEDTEWSGYENRTGNVLVVMIGDDQRHSVDPDDLLPIARQDYCGECGQIGCRHDGLDRDDDEE